MPLVRDLIRKLYHIWRIDKGTGDCFERELFYVLPLVALLLNTQRTRILLHCFLRRVLRTCKSQNRSANERALNDGVYIAPVVVICLVIILLLKTNRVE